MDVIAAPLLLALGVLLVGAAVVRSPAIYIDQIAVPEPLELNGYSSEAVEERIAREILDIERRAVARPHPRELAIASEAGVIETVAAYVDVLPILRAIQESAGLIEYIVDGDIFVEGEQLVLHIVVKRPTGESTVKVLERPQGETAELIAEAAKVVMSVTQPYILCAAELRTAVDTGGSIEGAERCVTDALGDPESQGRIWLHNLAGIMHFLRGDQTAALSEFRRSVQIDRGFSPSLLNIGVVYAMHGWHDEAIKFFRHVFDTPTRGASAQTYAVTRVEWAKSLVALGRPAEAEAMLAAAVRADPMYAPTYLCWAELAKPEARAAQLLSQGQVVAGAEEQMFTGNLVGIIRDRGAAQAASRNGLGVPIASCS